MESLSRFMESLSQSLIVTNMEDKREILKIISRFSEQVLWFQGETTNWIIMYLSTYTRFSLCLAGS